MLQEFNITTIDSHGRDNLVANFLSRMKISQDIASVLVPDDFPNEDLFVVSTFTPWFVDMANYLVTRRLPRIFPTWKNITLCNEVPIIIR